MTRLPFIVLAAAVLSTLTLLAESQPQTGTQAEAPRNAAPPTFDQDHATFARVLRDFVKDGRVDYAGLKRRPADLDAYLDAIAGIAPAEFRGWGREERIALLINLYNARTLRLIADRYPVASIRSIGLLPGAAWKQKIVRFDGKTLSLDDLEHGILRKEYTEPRVHFALVCAARSCPPLREEPFRASTLDQQLDDQGRRFLAQPDKNRFEVPSNTLWLSPIFDWFAADFTAGGKTIAGFVAPFLPESQRGALLKTQDAKVRFTAYDWSLNEQERGPANAP